MELEEIKLAVTQLSPEELRVFSEWLHEEFDALIWDQQIENDIQAGRLDAVANEAINAFQTSRLNNR